MSKLAMILLSATVLLLVSLAYGQRPPELNDRGEAYLRVNMNPTDVPPMVNINPFGNVPSVEVTRMPEIRVNTSGCGNFRTGIGNSISGPLMISYLNIPGEAKVTLVGPNGNQSVSLGPDGQITTAIFLQAGQRLEFGSAIMYSGCQPN